MRRKRNMAKVMVTGRGDLQEMENLFEGKKLAKVICAEHNRFIEHASIL